MQQLAFTCPLCGFISYNPHDLANRYCGNCHVFVDDAGQPRTVWGNALARLVDVTRSVAEIARIPGATQDIADAAQLAQHHLAIMARLITARVDT